MSSDSCRRSKVVKVCEFCGTEFHPWVENPNQKFCSRKCGCEAKKAETAKNSLLYCVYCGELFIRKPHSKTLYCEKCIQAGHSYDGRRKHHRDDLDKDAMKARKMGMSYGMWRASMSSHFRPSSVDRTGKGC